MSLAASTSRNALLLSLLLEVGACASSAEDTTVGGPGATPGGGGAQGADAGQNAAGGGGATTTFEECAADTFQTGLARSANIVWVIDTSGSMDEEAALVQQNMNAFVQAIVGAGLADYRVVVVSERAFVNVPEPLASDATHFRMIEEEVGSNEPLEDLLARHADYEAFLLPGAMTHFVVVTDDESDLGASAFLTEMRMRQSSELRVHAIASPPGATPPPAPADAGDPWEDLFGDGDDEDDTGCVGSYGDASAAGVEHYAAAAMTSGLTFSICEADWSPLFAELASVVGQTATIPCSVAIPRSETGAAVDPLLVNVVIGGGSGERVIPRVAGASSCTGEGWYYDDPGVPTQITLCQSACDAVRSNATLSVAVGCATMVR